MPAPVRFLIRALVVPAAFLVSDALSPLTVDAGDELRHAARHMLRRTFCCLLSFPLGEPNSSRLSGELVIGAEVALAQAAERGHDVQAELALYVIHGLLHLCGYDDHDPAGAAAMRARERHYLRQLGLPDVAPRADDDG